MRTRFNLTLFFIFNLFLVACSKTQTNVSQDPFEKVYNLDPQRKFIDTQIKDVHFDDLVTGKTIHFDQLSDKIVIIESFSVGCPACAAGIRQYNEIYDKYGDDVQIIYLNINPSDSEQDILDIKQKYNGRDWIWVKYSLVLQDFLSSLKINGNEITYIVKNNTIEYADSYAVPFSRIENALKEILAT